MMTVARILYQHPLEADSAVRHLHQHTFKGVPLHAVKMANNLVVAKREARLVVRNLPFDVGD